MDQATVTEGIDVLPFVVAELGVSTSGRPLMVIVSGDGNPQDASTWLRLRIFRDIGSGYIAMSSEVQLENNSANENVPYTLHFLDTGIASLTGTYVTYALCVTTVYGQWEFGETEGPDISIFEI
jgi:hypothetical protein